MTSFFDELTHKSANVITKGDTPFTALANTKGRPNERRKRWIQQLPWPFTSALSFALPCSAFSLCVSRRPNLHPSQRPAVSTVNLRPNGGT